MRHAPHNGQEWILHVIDHWSKFIFACPLRSKSVRKVAGVLQMHVFSVFGLPSILQSNSGREFVDKVIEEVASTWPGPIQLVSGHPRRPQSQGLVEQTHYTLDDQCKDCGDWRTASSMDRLDPLHCLWVVLTLAHAHEGYSTHFVCSCVCVC